MQENQFDLAYDYFLKLTDIGVDSHEVMTGKLICMMELNMQDQAEEFCEDLIARKDQYFAYYVHIYSTLLFQSSKYKEVMYLIEDALEEQNIPDHIAEQLRHMYQLSSELQEQDDKQSYIEIEKQLEEAMKEKNDRKQWYMVKRLLQLKTKTDKAIFRKMLQDPAIHPVVKTAILEYYEKLLPSKPLQIEKFNLMDTLDMPASDSILPTSFFTGVTQYLEDVQHHDPTKYQMIQFILERFAYVFTPFLPQKENYQVFAESLNFYVSKSFQLMEDGMIVNPP
ncbi:TPR repeat protein [Gracilibacillus boraciitolerans JCM 21714]|uniref:TPR repeat protein n=1 Tax=Gracilibacillus boraciitolerans JCM 21714 TaxID=1298598 RepID=W4VHI2_9BACI|nr:hypothetical protein [Gracilibacillus boraciitolerans]GAE92662.1 TPR repeat protein [Gracilibacillus boraciitolerans JCM 21714]